jgi:hypothetical protein
MRRLYVLFLVLALVMATAGVAAAGVEWDGDPVLNVHGAKVWVDFGIDDGSFVAGGGQIIVLAVAPKINVMSPGPDFIHAFAIRGGQEGYLRVTAYLRGQDAPETFQIRVRVPAKGCEQTVTVANGVPAVFDLP